MATISDFIIKIRTQGAEAVDKLKNSVDAASKSVDGFNKKADDFAKNKLTENVGKLSNALNGSLPGAGKFADVLGSMGSKMGLIGALSVGAVAGFTTLGIGAMNLADSIADISDATGISAGRLLNFKQSLIEAGGKAEDMEKIATKLSVSLGEAGNGNEKIRKTFRDLGVALGDANGQLRDSDEILPEVLSALANIENPAQRAAIAVELLGKSAKNIDWTKVSAGKDAVKDEQIKALADYRSEIDKLANAIETKLLTAFGKIAVAVNKDGYLAGLAASIEQMGRAIGKIPGFGFATTLANKAEAERIGASVGGGRGGQGGPTAAELQSLNTSKAKTGELSVTDEGKASIASAQAQTKAIKETNEAALQYQRTILGTIGIQQTESDVIRATAQIEQQRAAKVAELQKAMVELNKQQNIDPRVKGAQSAEIQKQIDLTNKFAADSKNLKEQEIRDTAKVADAQANLNQQLAFQANDLQLKLAAGQNTLIGLSGIELQRKQELMKIEDERVMAIQNAQAKIEALGDRATAGDISRAGAEIQRAKDVADQRVKILEDRLAREEALKNNAAAGEKKAMEDLAAGFTPYNMAQKKTQALWGSIESALDKFVDTGKLNFGDFTRSIIADMLKIELKSAAMTLFKSAGGFSGIMGGLGSMLGFAEGGEPPVGVPSIVGEKGPELFVPRTAGTIIPNSALGGGGQSVQNTYITNNISAVDAKSVAQLFAENRKLLLGVTEQARKELPVRQRF